jgi:pyruvate dehydrogenase E1 component alpha subunit
MNEMHAMPDNSKLLDMYRQMLTIRFFEEKVFELYGQNLVPGTIHLYAGEEAVAVGVCANLRKDDYITSTHRGHGHCIAKGARLDKTMAEILGRKTGYCKGKGGSMHIADFSVGMLGATAVVGAGIPIATGAGLSIKLRGTDQVAACFFGDGASNQGTFHEGINLAAVWHLPVVFVCENNLYAMGTALALSESETDIERKAACYRMAAEVVDGMDVVAVEAAARRAIHAIREHGTPYFLECRTYRLRAHSMFDAQLYRDKVEVDAWREKEPIKRFRDWLEANHMVHPQELTRIETEVDAEINGAVNFAEAAEWEPIEQLTRFTYADAAKPPRR